MQVSNLENVGGFVMRINRSVVLFLLVLLVLLFCGGSTLAAQQRYKRTIESYTAPDITLINQDREQVSLTELINSEQPVMLDFVYATCTTICPVLSISFSTLQKKLGDEADRVKFVSITIDPENDSPEIMKEYLERYQARPGWDFLTGSRKDIDIAMNAFDAYVPNKMSHYPLTLLRSPKTGKWVRIYGLIGSKDFMQEYRKLEK